MVRCLVACLILAVGIPIFQHDWRTVFIEFSSDSLFCLIFTSSGIVP